MEGFPRPDYRACPARPRTSAALPLGCVRAGGPVGRTAQPGCAHSAAPPRRRVGPPPGRPTPGSRAAVPGRGSAGQFGAAGGVVAPDPAHVARRQPLLEQSAPRRSVLLGDHGPKDTHEPGRRGTDKFGSVESTATSRTRRRPSRGTGFQPVRHVRVPGRRYSADISTSAQRSSRRRIEDRCARADVVRVRPTRRGYTPHGLEARATFLVVATVLGGRPRSHGGRARGDEEGRRDRIPSPRL